MTIKVALEHRTTYEFDRTVVLAPHVVRLRPAPHSRTPIEAYSLRVDPAEHFLNWQQDPFGNFEARLVFPEPATRLEIVVDLVADLTVINPFDFFLEEDAEHAPFEYERDLRADLGPYLTVGPAGPLVRALLAEIGRPSGERTIDFLVAINQLVQQKVDYTVRLEPGTQTPEQTLDRALGSCRDSAWLLVHLLRHFGFAARFVSGYLVQLTADEKPLEGPAGPEADFTDLHAWTEVFLPGAGWVGLDPTSGLLTGEGHIPLAATPDPRSAAPITGATSVCEVEFSYDNIVRRVHEDPRVTLPYDDDQWTAIDDLGRRIDERLVAGDVRLTMGGEPTFVSTLDRESPEWRTRADGPAKRQLAAELTTRLHDRFAPGGLVHHGQGKWYPGEPLPRWQKAIVWRKDGAALWHDRALLADPDLAGDLDTAKAEPFLQALAERLGFDGSTIRAGHEDPIHALWQEALLPVGQAPDDDLDPTDPDLFEEDKRRSITRRLDARHGSATGWVLPIHRDIGPGGVPRWASARWTTRRRELFLAPGDSPMGYRLPVRSLAWDGPPPAFEESLFAQLRPLPDATGPAGPGVPSVVIEGNGPPTALCAEVRNGRLHLFLPPCDSTADALELIGAIEETAADLATPVVLEGYPIPSDPRLETLVVAPDPAVIEVNVPPATDWVHLKEIIEGVHAEARNTRLGTETFDLDGTHTGTGGGNHVTIGGPTPADSPLLRRPSLLRSLVTYWQHHPSLSYLFSGRFIGPSSQAPRVDEARDDNLYELDTALAELDRLGDDVAPWVVDRALRNLLIDVTGNTHRSEFSIDKLFSPEGERGRLGVLELRAFEMPPHPRMALLHALLVRGIVARCWDEPFRRRPVRWGTALHDRYLLPWYAERDLDEVVDDLAEHGLDFRSSWFAPFMEFRFPRLGTVTVGGVTLEVRGAIEPWHVLGEEVTSSGMARYVDSSTERVQLRVEGFDPERHAITCNGAELPLTATDVPGLRVAGIRYKAWQPASGLHPTIGIDSPLTFDVVERSARRSIGGARYHVVHPGGLAHERFPVNAGEAESRRQARFEPFGHTPGRLVPEDLRLFDHREYPVTLDLRRVRRV